MEPFDPIWAQGLIFKDGSPYWALGLGKFEPHDFRAKNTRINRLRQKINFSTKITQDYIWTHTEIKCLILWNWTEQFSGDSSHFIGLPLGYGVKRISNFYVLLQGPGTPKAVLANQNEAQETFPQTTFSLC